MTTPEFSYVVEIDRIPSAGGQYDLTAPPESRARLASRLDLLELKALTAHFAVKVGAGGIVHVTGRVQAEVVQACVVSLAPVPAVVDEEVEAAFISAERPGRKKAKSEDEEEIVGLDGEDPPEVVEDGRIDLGELAVTQVALVLDPYPRAPGVVFNPGTAGLGGSGGGEDKPAGPFAALAKLKKTLPK